MNTASLSHETAVRLNRHSFLAGPAEQILLHQVPQDKYPVEVTVFKYLRNPLADRFVPTPTHAPTMNGQLVNTATHLMCSKCGGWKLDDHFRQDTRRGSVRRGRMYYCRTCLSKNPVYLMGEGEELPPVVRGRPKKNGKNKKHH